MEQQSAICTLTTPCTMRTMYSSAALQPQPQIPSHHLGCCCLPLCPWVQRAFKFDEVSSTFVKYWVCQVQYKLSIVCYHCPSLLCCDIHFLRIQNPNNLSGSDAKRCRNKAGCTAEVKLLQVWVEKQCLTWQSQEVKCREQRKVAHVKQWCTTSKMCFTASSRRRLTLPSVDS